MNNFTRVTVSALLLGLSFTLGGSAQAEVIASDSCTEGHASHRYTMAFDPSVLSPNADFPYLTVKVGKTSNYSPDQSQKLARAIRLMETALNSEVLKAKILAHTWKGNQQFSDNQGRSNTEIYESIRRAMEIDVNTLDFTAEFNHALYYKRFSKVVGSTDIGEPWIYTDTKYFNPYSDAEVAGHLAHEWLHQLGYLHQETFPASVPYAVGDMVAEIAAQLTAQ